MQPSARGMSDDRRRGFESWARTNGDAAVRSHDRRGIAEDIFDAAGIDKVATSHIEEVSRRYRERLAGAQKVLLARQVGDEILRWQREPHRALVQRGTDSRREDDEIIGIQLDSMTLSAADVEAAVVAKSAAASAPPRRSDPAQPRESGRSERPSSSPPGGVHTASPAQPVSSAQWSAVGARGGASPGSSSSARDSSAPPSSSSSSGVERARSEGAVDWAVAPRSTAPKADGEEQGLWAPLRGPSSPAPPPAELHAPPLGLPPGPPPLSAPPLGPPPGLSGRPSAPPPAGSRGAISFPPLAGPPGGAQDGAAPPAPAHSASPSTHPASHPPSRRPRAPDSATKTFEIEGDAIRATPAPEAASPSPGWPSATAPSTSGFAVPRVQPGGGFARRYVIIAGVVAAALAALVIVVRTNAVMNGRPVEVSGHTVSEHLGISVDLGEPWTHERKKDDTGSQHGFRRATSTYFQGVTAEDYVVQLTLVSLSPQDHPATADDVRKVGATELSPTVSDRVCVPFDRAGSPAFRCVAKTTYKARSFAMMEEYFLEGSRVIYARALVEALAADLPSGPPRKGAAESPVSDRKASPIAEVDEAKIQAILDSISSL